jgi:hypothetical protein
MFYELKREAHTSSNDFSRFFHDYIKHSPLQLTSAGFSITMSNTLTASTEFSRFFHDYIKHIPFQLTSAGFSMTISITPLRLMKNLLKSFEEVCA